MTADVHALTGAYVLDAVSDMERDEFEEHLRECETCSLEVYELRETATRLGRASAAVPPPHLKAAVMAQIRQVRQDPPQAAVVVPLRRRRGSWAVRLTSAAAAVLLVVAATLGVLLVQAQNATDTSDQQARAMLSILTAGDAKVSSDAADGGRMTVLSSRTADRALLLTDNLPDPGPERDYQAWRMRGAEAVPAGLLPDGGTTTLEVDGISAAEQIGITIEPTGGSDAPTQQPIMVFSVV